MTRREREVTDLNEIISILDKCKIVHLGLVDHGKPYVVPMNYGYTMEEGRLTLYLHGAAKGYKQDVIHDNPNVCFEMECDVVPFAGEVACQYGITYQSIIGRGTAEVVTDIAEKQRALSILMKTQTGKDFTFTEKMVSIVSVIEIHVSEYTAKRRPLPAALQNVQNPIDK